MRSTPWLTPASPRHAPLRGEVRADVAVIGGGVTGLTAAAILTQRGQAVVLLERDRLGGGDSGHTTAHLTAVLDRRPADLVDHFGVDQAGALWDAGSAAIDLIDQLARQHAIECGFARIPGYLHVPIDSDAAAVEDLHRSFAACHTLGLEVAWHDRVPLVGTPGLRVSRQARIEPARYLGGLAAALAADGVAIHEHTEVTDIAGPPFVLHTAGGTVRAERLVIATHVPRHGVAGALSAGLTQSRLAAYTSYVLRAAVAVGSLPDALFWDTADPYRYLRLDRCSDGDYVIFGGADHKTGQAPSTDPFATLAADLASLTMVSAVTHEWSGQVIESSDGLPFIGESADGQFSATGYGGNGMTWGTLAGLMAADWAGGVANPWSELLSWSRTGLAAGGLRDYVRENADYPYYLIRDRLAAARERRAADVPRGAGQVLTVDGRRVAVFRDDDGGVVERSAVCTHLGCTVAWNVVERTWDCPCHGSRFRPDGSVLAGPAERPLASADGDADDVERAAAAEEAR